MTTLHLTDEQTTILVGILQYMRQDGVTQSEIKSVDLPGYIEMPAWIPIPKDGKMSYTDIWNSWLTGAMNSIMQDIADATAVQFLKDGRSSKLQLLVNASMHLKSDHMDDADVCAQEEINERIDIIQFW